MECNWEECKLKNLDGKLSCFIIFHKLLWEDFLLANEYKTEDQITFFFLPWEFLSLRSKGVSQSNSDRAWAFDSY